MSINEIRLDSTTLVITVAAVTLVTVFGVPWMWDRWRKRPLGRGVSVLIAVLLLVVSVGLAGNLIGGFFPTVGALTGQDDYVGKDVNLALAPGDSDVAKVSALGEAQAAQGKGTVIQTKVLGTRSNLQRRVVVYLPPQYFDKAYTGYKFPVVELIPNYPSGPEVMTDVYAMSTQVDSAIAKKTLPPSIFVVPDPTSAPKVGHDTECVDEVGGTANDTFLTADIREWVGRKYAANMSRDAWTIAGWSSGGYCALNLVTRHPQWYTRAASVSGYDRAQVDGETENLFKGRQDIDDANNASINLRLHPSPVDLLAVSGSLESNESAAIARMSSALQAPAQFSSWSVPDAGHNLTTFRSQIPAVLAWIGARSPWPVPAGQQITTTGGVRAWPLPGTGARGGLAGTAD